MRVRIGRKGGSLPVASWRSRRRHRARSGVLMLLLALAAVRPVFAERIAPTDPATSVDEEVIIGNERDITIWDEALAGKATDGYDASVHRQALVCISNDPEQGGCSSVPVFELLSGVLFDSEIRLTFKNEPRKDAVVLTLLGHKTNVATASGEVATMSMHNTNPEPMVSSRGTQPGEVRYSLKIPASELKKLRLGGVWTAGLKMRLIGSTPGEPMASWTAAISLTVKDAPQIWLPQMDGGATLPVRLTPIHGGQLEGRAAFEACLYDGFGGESREYRLSMSGAAADRQFAIYRDGSRNAADALPYRLFVSALGGGPPVKEVAPGAPEIFGAIATENMTRLAADQICAPLNIEVRIPPFDPSAKHAGDYEGTLRLEYTPVIR